MNVFIFIDGFPRKVHTIFFIDVGFELIYFTRDMYKFICNLIFLVLCIPQSQYIFQRVSSNKLPHNKLLVKNPEVKTDIVDVTITNCSIYQPFYQVYCSLRVRLVNHKIIKALERLLGWTLGLILNLLPILDQSLKGWVLQIAKVPLQISFKHSEPFLAFLVNF